jgi:hypothetical protein
VLARRLLYINKGANMSLSKKIEYVAVASGLIGSIGVFLCWAYFDFSVLAGKSSFAAFVVFGMYFLRLDAIGIGLRLISPLVYDFSQSEFFAWKLCLASCAIFYVVLFGLGFLHVHLKDKKSG